MEIIKLAVKLIMSHFFGDYVLQIDFIAKTKGTNWYHLLVHCVLYCIPFAILFGIDFRLLVVFVVHFITDALKARYNKINYVIDQLIHFVVLCIYLF